MPSLNLSKDQKKYLGMIEKLRCGREDLLADISSYFVRNASKEQIRGLSEYMFEKPPVKTDPVYIPNMIPRTVVRRTLAEIQGRGHEMLPLDTFRRWLKVCWDIKFKAYYSNEELAQLKSLAYHLRDSDDPTYKGWKEALELKAKLERQAEQSAKNEAEQREREQKATEEKVNEDVVIDVNAKPA